MARSIIRNLDGEVAERRGLRARLRGVPVEQQARRALAEGTRVSRAEIAALAAVIPARRRPQRARRRADPGGRGPASWRSRRGAVARARWTKLRRGEMSRSDVDPAATNLLAPEIGWTPSTTLLRPALRPAADPGHPVPDLMSLALAASHPAMLATADGRLRRGAERVGVRAGSAQAR